MFYAENLYQMLSGKMCIGGKGRLLHTERKGLVPILSVLLIVS